MLTLIPTACGCHTLQSPPIEKDDRLNLHVRTGSALILYNSFVFTFGGLTIGLELDGNISIDYISTTFMQKITNNKLTDMRRYLSGELFFLDLISRAWSRVPIAPDQPRPRPRLFHEVSTGKGCIYVFGGLVISEDTDAFLLVPCNDLWQFDLLSKSWLLLHDGSGWQTNPLIPCPRYSHKLTTIDSLTFVNKSDHFGILIAGGCDANSTRICNNSVYDFVDKCYVDAGPPLKYPTARDTAHDGVMAPEPENLPANFKLSANLHPLPPTAAKELSINYLDSSIVSFTEDAEARPALKVPSPGSRTTSKPAAVQSLYIYSPTDINPDEEFHNPIMISRLGKQIYPPKSPPLWKNQEAQPMHKKSKYVKRTVPYNLRYPTGGLFGQNLVLIGFLANDYDISIFIYNKPTGKWSRMNIFCHHPYGSHRFWGGFVWSSHHKVVLLGNYVTSQTTSSVRYFSSMITVSLPVTNILASMEFAGGNLPGKVSHHNTFSDFSSMSDALSTISGEELMSESELSRRVGSSSQNNEDQIPGASFNDYVHYAAPKVKFTKVRSMFPPAAITLGRNALRYGDLLSDFELISSNGDRIPVCLSILEERWGKYFIDLLARAYVRAVDQFERNEIQSNPETKAFKPSHSSASVESDLHKQANVAGGSSLLNDSPIGEAPAMKDPFQKDAPHFRLPFQDNVSPSNEEHSPVMTGEIQSVDPFKQNSERRHSQISNASGNSVLKYHLKEIPAQLPLPKEPIPGISSAPVSFRSSSRKNSSDFPSPRGSLLHTLTALRSIPSGKSKVEFSLSSPTASGPGSHERLIDEVVVQAREIEKGQRELENAKEQSGPPSDANSEFPRYSPSSSNSPSLYPSPSKSRSLLDLQKIDVENFGMEPSLIPRKLYMPFGSNSVKAFAEYFYTGQVGNKWLLHPCTLDCLLMSRYFKVPLLYDLICEVLYGIIGRKEALVLEEGELYKKKFKELFDNVGISWPDNFRFPLDEYADFMNSVDDGYMDIALLRKSSNIHKLSTSSGGSKRKSSVRTADALLSPISEPKADGPIEGTSSASQTSLPAAEDESELNLDSSPSASDEESSGLHYLDYQNTGTMPGIRYKSVFDKTVYDTVNPAKFNDNEESSPEADNLSNLTLEMLVSPDYPQPSNYVIDLILDMASLCTDVKLMLRSMNARQMGLSLEQTKKNYSALCKKYEAELANVARGEVEEKPSPEQKTEQYMPPLATKKSSTLSAPSLKSFSTITQLLKGETSAPVEKSSSLEKVKMMPFKDQKSEALQLNRKLDRHIAHMIKKDERMKIKAEKEEKEKEKSSRKEKINKVPDAPSEWAPPNTYRERSQSNSSVVTAARLGQNDNEPKTSRFKKLGQRLKPKKEAAPTTLHRLESTMSLQSSVSKRSNGSRISETTMRSFFGKKK